MIEDDPSNWKHWLNSKKKIGLPRLDSPILDEPVGLTGEELLLKLIHELHLRYRFMAPYDSTRGTGNLTGLVAKPS